MSLTPKKFTYPAHNNHQPSPPQNLSHLISLISEDPLLLSYFSQQTSQQHYLQFAKKLMIDGIRFRTQQTLRTKTKKGTKNSIQCASLVIQKKSPQQKTNERSNNKHYNVAYIKHNRFLSPKQRKDMVTPKVTEVIPKSPPHVIYGKPKVKVDEEIGCPYHSDEEENKLKYGVTQNREEQKINLIKKQEEIQHEWEKTKEKERKESEKNKGYQNSTVYVDKIVKIESKKPIKVLEESSDDEYLRQKFKKGRKKEKGKKVIQSKIKFLVDRDKNNKLLEKKLQKQQHQIKKLQQRMEQQQLQKEKEKVSHRKIKILSSDILSLSSDSFSSVNENLYKYHETQPKQYEKNAFDYQNSSLSEEEEENGQLYEGEESVSESGENGNEESFSEFEG